MVAARGERIGQYAPSALPCERPVMGELVLQRALLVFASQYSLWGSGVTHVYGRMDQCAAKSERLSRITQGTAPRRRGAKALPKHPRITVHIGARLLEQHRWGNNAQDIRRKCASVGATPGGTGGGPPHGNGCGATVAMSDHGGRATVATGRYCLGLACTTMRLMFPRFRLVRLRSQACVAGVIAYASAPASHPPRVLPPRCRVAQSQYLLKPRSQTARPLARPAVTTT